MSGNTNLTVVAAVAVLALLAGGLFMAGVFDAEPKPKPGPVLPGMPETPEVPRRTSKESGSPRVSPIKTTEFNEGSDRDAGVARVDLKETGIRCGGVVLDPSGQGIAKAEVSLIRDVSAIKTRPQEGDVLATVKTRDDGTFLFEGMIPGDLYVLRAAHADYTTERCFPIDPKDPTTLQRTIQLQAGLFIEGTVSDASGAPVGDADVLVYDMNVQSLDPIPVAERAGRSSPDGSYKVQHLTRGMKKMWVRKEGYSTDGRNALDLRDTGTTGKVNFTLTNGFHIKGLVRDGATSQLLKGAVVTARPVSYLGNQLPDGVPAPVMPPDQVERGDTRPQGRPVRAMAAANAISQKSFLLETALTNDRGEFMLSGLMPARYLITVRTVGYQTSTNNHADAGAEGLNIALTQSARITGQVLDDETGQPIPQFSVAVSATPEPQYIPTQSRQRFEDKDGRFEYVDVRPGKQYLIAEAEGYAGGKSEPLVVAPEQTLEGIVVRVVRGAKIAGRVMTSAGEPVRNAQVSVASSANEAQANNLFLKALEHQMRRSGRSTLTDAKGEYSIDGVMAGTYLVKVDHPDFAAGQSDPVTCENRGEVNVPPVSLNAGGTIKGTVKFEGKPDPRASVMISNTDPTQWFSQTRQTGPDGEFQVKGLKPGSYRVVVTQRNGTFDISSFFAPQGTALAQQQVVSIGEGESISLDL